MKKRPFLLASLLIGGIFLFFLLVIFAAGWLRPGALMTSSAPKIGILEVQGVIENEGLVLRQIQELLDNEGVRAVVLRVNSPGGGVAPSQEIHAELLRLAAAKPLVVSFGSVVASGGYYIAVAGERLFANPGTMTGSIGVIMHFSDYQGLMQKVGIRSEVIKSGEYKDVGSTTRSMTDAERQLLQQLVDDVHEQFVQAVSAGRDIRTEDLAELADGRILTGRQALEVGLIDELGTFADAVAHAASRVGLPERPDLFYPTPEKTGFIERYLNLMISRYIGTQVAPYRSPGLYYLWPGF